MRQPTANGAIGKYLWHSRIVTEVLRQRQTNQRRGAFSSAEQLPGPRFNTSKLEPIAESSNRLTITLVLAKHDSKTCFDTTALQNVLKAPKLFAW